MTTSADPELPGARVLSAGAHELRNHVATIRMASRLVDDDEVAASLDEASTAIQVALERAIVLARVELGQRPDTVQLTAGELCELALRRARREGAPVDDLRSGPADGLRVTVPGPWAERLVADLLHHGAGSSTVAADGGRVRIDVPLAEPVAPPLDSALGILAEACGGTLHWEDARAVLQLPLADAISGG